MLLYKGDNGILILRSKEKYVRELLPKKSTLQIIYTGKKLGSQINIKDRTNFEHQHNLIYHVNCPIPTCENNLHWWNCIHINERIKYHNGRDHTSCMLKLSIEKHHDIVTQENLKIIAKKLRITNGDKKYQKHSR